MVRTLACVLALFFSAAACGDDAGGSGADRAVTSASPTGLTADEQKAIASLSGANSDPELSPRTSKDSKCMATGFVDQLGLEKLKEYGFLNEDLSANDSLAGDLPERDAATIVDVILECVDYRDYVAAMVAPDAPDSDPYVRRCTSVVTENEVRTALVAAFSGGDFHASSFARNLSRAGCGFEGD
jgi:hypothetical protein